MDALTAILDDDEDDRRLKWVIGLKGSSKARDIPTQLVSKTTKLVLV